jgi:peptidoglycan/xylan/chitin deacetylase (PgdA/CDA1 family)
MLGPAAKVIRGRPLLCSIVVELTLLGQWWGCSSSHSLPLQCVQGLAACGSECADLQLDVANCGACGRACAIGEACTQGACTATCASPFQTCGTGPLAICVDTMSDSANCGACGQACAIGEICSLGTCHVGCSGGGWMLCDDQCVDTSYEQNHCGDCTVACSADQACVEGACVPSALAKQPRLIVSFTADDTYAEQFTFMAPVLEAHGMRATMMVNAGRLGLPGDLYLSNEQISELQAVGHEIGSHGLTHQHLVTAQNLPDRIAREVCDSRVDLLARGFRVRTLAYPFGEVDGVAQSWVANCGYTTGRLVGNLSSALWSETVPPQKMTELRASSSVTSANTLEDVQGYVLNAESHASGVSPAWLIINFHRFCPGATCNPGLAWDTDLFAEFIAWVAQREALGTVVRTISQVAPGPLLPAVASSTPLVLNGDLESNLAGTTSPPDCWTYGHSGDNTATWTRVPGRTGYGQQLVVTQYASGSNTLLLARGTSLGPDYKSCGIPIKPGRHYELSCWYRSDVPVAFTLYKNDDVDDMVSPWMTTDASPASPQVWAQRTFGITIPDGIVKYNTLFYGPHVSSICPSGCLHGDGTATLLVDDCSAVDDTAVADVDGGS